MTNYASTAAEILAVQARANRRRELARRSDALLEAIEQWNVRAYRPAAPQEYVEGGRKTVRLPVRLANAVNALLADAGLPVRELHTTADGLEAVWSGQRRIFGLPDDDEDVDDEAEAS